MLPAELRGTSGTIEIPSSVTAVGYDLVIICSAAWWPSQRANSVLPGARDSGHGDGPHPPRRSMNESAEAQGAPPAVSLLHGERGSFAIRSSARNGRRAGTSRGAKAMRWFGHL